MMARKFSMRPWTKEGIAKRIKPTLTPPGPHSERERQHELEQLTGDPLHGLVYDLPALYLEQKSTSHEDR